MNITTFKERAKQFCRNNSELKRLENLGSKHYKFLTMHVLGTKYNSIDETNIEWVWKNLNILLAEEEKKHKELCELVKGKSFTDYSHLAYNGVTEDF